MSIRESIFELYQKGLTYKQISEETGLKKSTISYHLKKSNLGIPMNKPKNIPWKEINDFYQQTKNRLETLKKFDIHGSTFRKAQKRGVISPLPIKPIEETKDRGSLKRKIKENDLIPYICSVCNMLPQWNGKELVLVLDHINGINNDNRLENLRFLCPNCNSQTPTFSGRNMKKRR